MNWNGKYVTIESIIEKVYRDSGTTDSVNIDDIVNWVGDAMELLGAPYHLTEKLCTTFVKDYRASIPGDLHYINTIRGSGETSNSDCSLEDLSSRANFLPMRYSTDAFHHWYCSKSDDRHCDTDLTYKVNDNFIFTNFKEGIIQISYKAMPTDKNGYPLIPDDVKFREAGYWYVRWKLGMIQLGQSKINGDLYKVIDQEKCWAMAAAQNRANMPSIDLMESIKNNWIRLIPKINQHRDGFKEAGHREERFTKNSHVIGRGNHQLDERQRSDRTFFYYQDSAMCDTCGDNPCTCNNT